MKRTYSTGEKLLFASPLLLILAVAVASMWQKSRPVTIEIGGDSIEHLSYSPDGNRLLVFSRKAGRAMPVAEMYSVASGSKICELQTPLTAKREPSFMRYWNPSWSNDGSRIVMPYNDNTTGTTKIKNGSSTSAPPLGVPNFRFNRVSKFGVWDANTGTLTGNHLYAPLNEESDAHTLRFSSDDKHLIGESSPPAIFDAATGMRLQRLRGTSPRPWEGALNEKLGLLALIELKPYHLEVFDTKTKRVVFQTPIEVMAFVKWHDDIMAAVIKDRADIKRLLLWDGKTRQRLPLPPLRFPNVGFRTYFNPSHSVVIFNNYGNDSLVDGQRIVNQELVAWDYRQNRILWRYPTSGELSGIEWSPDGQWLAATRFRDNSLLLFNRNGQLRSERNLLRPKYIWSPDSRHIATPIHRKDQPARIEIFNIGE